MSSQKPAASPMFYICRRNGRVQRLLCADLEEPSSMARIEAMLPEKVRLVYSDPPWNPGNATYWRTHAAQSPCHDYNRFLDCIVAVVALCIRRGASDVFVEQSANTQHSDLFVQAAMRNDDWGLAMIDTYRVFYRAGSKMLPNSLQHFGIQPILTNPSGMHGEPMSIRTVAGVRDAPPGSWIVDPCMGKGTTSRMGHYFDWNVVGIELNPKRLAHTVGWLKRQGYEVTEG